MPTAQSSLREGDKQYLSVMKVMWDIVEKHFDPVKVLTAPGHSLIQTYSIKASHHELPYVMHFLAMMCALVNGAKTNWFPNNASPMFLMVLNVNYTQTRKSSLTDNGDDFGDQLDKVVRDAVSEKIKRARRERQEAQPSARPRRQEEQPGPGDTPKEQPAITSSVLHSATPAEFFHRFAWDFEQVANAELFPGAGLSGRQNFGILVNLDEAYDLLMAFGLLDDGKNTAKAKTTVNPWQSAFNKLAQYGQASRVTKTSGAYGKADAPTISGGISGNMHPSTYVPMERGDSGSHHAATKERILIGTGRPIQPHAALPEDYAMPDGHPRWKWVPLVKDVAEIMQLQEGAASPDEARKVWGRVKAPTGAEAETEEMVVHGKVYVPDDEGFRVVLPDRVPTQVRFRKDPRSTTGFRAEWRTANRSFPMPAPHSLATCVPRVTKYFGEAHKILPPTEDALALHASYQGAFNVKSHMERERGDVHTGAAIGAAPWHLGELASALCVFDMFCGRYEDTDEYREGSVHVQEDHVDRAAALLKVLHMLKFAAVKTTDEEEVEPDASRADTERQEMYTFLSENAGEAFDGLWSQQLFAPAPGFEPTAPDSPRGSVLLQRGSISDAGGGVLGGGDEHKSADEEDEEEKHEEQISLDIAEADLVRAAGNATTLLRTEDVRGTDYGYGKDGASVQSNIHAKGLTDRAIMRRTLLLGTPSTTAKAACQNMRSSNATGKKALPEPAWMDVMKAGLENCDVAWLADRTVMIKEIPTDPTARIDYHNHLMNLCGLSLQSLVQAMRQAKAKHVKRQDTRARDNVIAEATCDDDPNARLQQHRAGPRPPAARLSQAARSRSPREVRGS